MLNKLADHSQGQLKGSFFNSLCTVLQGRALLLFPGLLNSYLIYTLDWTQVSLTTCRHSNHYGITYYTCMYIYGEREIEREWAGDTSIHQLPNNKKNIHLLNKYLLSTQPSSLAIYLIQCFYWLYKLNILQQKYLIKSLLKIIWLWTYKSTH